jgi:signal transduction histidine kinase/ligand-binding sensor domain-containing protein
LRRECTSRKAIPIPSGEASASCDGLCRSYVKMLRRVLWEAFRIAGLLYLFVFAADVSNAAPLSLKQFDHTAWTSKDGAPIAVFAMAQAPDGKLWLGSQSGLYQFDGAHFTAFRPPPGDPELPFIVVSAIEIARDGTIWVGGLQGGIAAIRGGHVSVYGPNEGLPSSGGIAQGGIVQSPEGIMWVVVRNHLLRLDQNHWHEEAWNNQPPRKDIEQVFFDRSGAQWIAAGGQIYSRANAGEPLTLRSTGSPDGTELAGATDGSMWALLTEHFAIPPIIVKQLTGSYGGVPRGTMSVGDQYSLIDDDGALWIGNDRGLLRFAPGKWPRVRADPNAPAESYGHVDGLSADSIISLFRDQAGSIWVGTSKGLDRFKRPALVRYLDTPLTGDALLTSCPNGDVWIASRDSPLVSIHDGVVVPHGYNRWIMSLFCDQAGVLWFGEQNGMWRDEADKLTYIPYPSDFPRLAARQISGDGDRLFVAIRRTGIWTLTNGKWSKFLTEGFPDETAYSLLKDGSEGLWAGYDRSRIVHMENGRGQILHTSGAGLGLIQILKKTRRGLLAGGANGLAILRGEAFQTLHTPDPAATQGVSGLEESSNGDIWINGAHGIFRVSSREVDAALKSPEYRMQAESLLLDGGPVGSALQGGYGPTLAIDGKGKLWFANIDEVVSFDPAAQPSPAIPSGVEITASSQDGIVHETQNPLSISRVHILRIGYLAVDLTSPERLRYRYRLDGEDKAWQDAGTRTEAAYTNLRPGTYSFHAAASNDGLVWREAAVPLTVRVLPSFYETMWFLVLCLSLATALIWFAISMRIASVSARIRERSEERANERVQIARDLHDTLLQGIQGLMLRFHFAAEKVPEGGEVRAMLDDALSSADHILQEGRERVTDLRSSTATRADLLKSLDMVGKGLSWNNDSSFAIHAEGTPRELKPAIHEELFYIGRESLTNAFRHAQAQRIEVTLDYGKLKLRLLCRDDGCGMDANLVEEGRSGHWGLPGMRERANRIEATLECQSAPGAGTEIVVIISARRAYAPAQRWPWLRSLVRRVKRRRPLR